MAALALATQAVPRKLRVGLFADSALQPRWVIEAFAKVAASEFAEIVVIATAAAPPAAAPWWWRLYARLDRRVFGAGTNPEERLDLARYVPHEGPALHLKTGSDPACFLDLDLDVAFALGEFDDAWLDGLARLGVWRFCFGSARDGCETLAGVREVAEGAALTGSAISPGRAPIRFRSRATATSCSPRPRSSPLARCARHTARATAGSTSVPRYQIRDRPAFRLLP